MPSSDGRGQSNGKRPGSGATWASGGMLAPVSEADHGEASLVRFGQDSLSLYPAFVENDGDGA